MTGRDGFSSLADLDEAMLFTPDSSGQTAAAMTRLSSAFDLILTRRLTAL